MDPWDPPPYYGRLGLIELLLWAILDCRHDLAVCLWKRSENPLRYALLASQLYARLAEQTTDLLEQAEGEGRAAQFESWGVQMLSECSPTMAIALLEVEGRLRAHAAWNARRMRIAPLCGC